MGRKPKSETNSYPCRQEELYETADSAWSLFVLHIGDFTKLNSSYGFKYYEDRMRDLENAKNINSRTVMQLELTRLRKELVSAKGELLRYYRSTKLFIKGMRNNSTENGIYLGINKPDYKKASNNNWDCCSMMQINLENILKNNKTNLLNNADMTEMFYDDCLSACKSFNVAYSKYNSMQIRMKIAAEEKVKLNNKIYADLTMMLRNAQFIYRNRREIQLLFQFDKLLKKSRKKKKTANTAETKPAVFSMLTKVAAMF